MVSEVPEKFQRVDVDPEAVVRPEEKMQKAFPSEAGNEARLADAASALLVWVLVNTRERTETIELDEAGNPKPGAGAELLILYAHTLIGVRALRAIRAARAVLARGYEGEARAYDRILVELNAHRRVIIDDPSGAEAFAWLQRKRTGGVTRRVGAMGNRELYRQLSIDAHGDPGAVIRLLDREANTIDMAPVRTEATRASLLLYAGFARDQAVLLAQLSGGKTLLQGIELLDAEIKAAWERLRVEKEAEGGNGVATEQPVDEAKPPDLDEADSAREQGTPDST